MNKPGIDSSALALQLQQNAEAVEVTPFVQSMYVNGRLPRNPMRDRFSRALIDTMGKCNEAIANDYLRSTLTTRTNALEQALSETESNPHADKTAAINLIRTARFYAPMLAELFEPRTDAPEERARIIADLNASADAVESGAEAYAYTIFDYSEAALAWQAAAQKLVDSMRAAVPYMPKWAANVGMNTNAMSMTTFIQTVRNSRNPGGSERAIVEVSKRFADKARIVAAIIA